MGSKYLLFWPTLGVLEKGPEKWLSLYSVTRMGNSKNEIQFH